MDANIIEPGAGTSITLGPIQMRVLEDGSRTRGALGLAEFAVPPGAPAPPPHRHHAHEEGFYVLEGELEFLVGDHRTRVIAGGFVQAPIGVVHTFANPGTKPARFLNTFTPRRYLDYFAEMSALMAASERLTPEQARDLMSRYDTEIVMPTGPSEAAAALGQAHGARS